jgi:hypothetical protein
VETPLGSRYVLHELLGRGAMGQVFPGWGQFRPASNMSDSWRGHFKASRWVQLEASQPSRSRTQEGFDPDPPYLHANDGPAVEPWRRPDRGDLLITSQSLESVVQK